MTTLKFDDPALNECLQAFLQLPPEDRITMSHFDLAELTDIKDLSIWIKFLKDPKVKDKLDEELDIYVDAQKRKLISLTTDKANSVGVAQMITALGKAQEKQEQTSTGPAFVYMYVPPNANEEELDNIEQLPTDPFTGFNI